MPIPVPWPLSVLPVPVAWRLEQARSQAVPPYVVFHDRTLLEIAERRPRDLAELAAVGGVGAAKLERYGAAVLAVVECADQGAGCGNG